MGIGHVAGIVRLHAEERPDQVAIVYGDREVTWRELHERSNRLANALLAAGVTADDRIARIEKNAPDYFELAFAASKVNAVLVDVNWRLAPAEMRQIIDDAGAKVLFVGEDFAPHLDKIEGDLATVERTVLLGAADATHESIDAFAAAQPDEDPGHEGRPDDICLQLYTSGTTGLPKGVMLSNQNLFSFIDEVPKQWEFTPESVSHVVMPTFHIAGSGWGLVSLAMGSRMVLDREVDPVRILQEVEAHGITHAIYVPAVLQFLQIVPNANEHDLSSMQLVAYGASPITEQVLRAAMAQFSTAEFVQLYGLTETTGAVVQLDSVDHDPDHRPELLRSAGKPYPWIEVRVVGADGEDVPQGEIGEIWIKGVQVMVGYWNNPTETARAITPDGWFRSGDAGYLDAEGYLFLHDRVKDMIVSGGENVYPAEVENAVMGCPGVADVAVIGVPDDKWGEAVKAICVKQPDADVTPDQVIAWTRERIAGFKVPKSVDFVAELPRNPSGKILKKDLRAPYWEGRERQIN
ncbi:MAG: long-chain-fatty-acid--CoA ligase [Acidimicrobiales bacterium]